MIPLLRKNIIFFISSSSQSQSRTLLFRHQCFQLSSSPSSYSHWKRLDDESRNVRVSVWWDFENCNVPAGVNVTKVAPAITDAVRANGIKGPVHITAFGDVLQLSKSNQEALAFTGIHLTHIPNGGKNSADRSLLVDLMYWVSQNPPPAHLFLISGDRDFAGILHRLRMNNYNILLAIPGKAPDVLRSAATIMWQWPSLLKGEDLTGKHYNHPPDGQFGSWYGNSKVPIESPFSAVEQSTSSQNIQIVEINEPSSDLKLGDGVRKSVVRQITHILSSHPNGISISDLRTELVKCGVSLGKSIFGYKRFSHFLSTIPHIQLQHLRGGNVCVYLIPSDSPNPSERSTALSTTSAESIIEDDSKSFQCIPSQVTPIQEDVSCKSSVSSEKVADVSCKSAVSNAKDADVSNSQLLESQLSTKDNGFSKTDIGSFKVRSKEFSDDDIVSSEDVSPEVLEKNTSSGNPSAGIDHTLMENNDIANSGSGKSIAGNKYDNQPRKEVDEVSHGPYSLAADDSLVEKTTDDCAEAYSKRSTFFGWIRNWWPFRKSNDAKEDDLTAHQNKANCNFENSKSSELDQTAKQNMVTCNFEDSKSSEVDRTSINLEKLKPSEEQHQDVSHSVKLELFSSDSFWNDMESFVFRPKGSLLISQSRSREDLAHKLQRHGPMDLTSLTESDIFQLVEMLIAEKKWLEENPLQAFPFRLTQSVQKSAQLGQSNGTNGLRSLFLSRKPQSNMQKSVEHDLEKKSPSIQQTRVSRAATEMNNVERSRSDILVDCKKLVSELARENPEGYNICSFQKHFADRYGYQLDIKKLGYPKMASLIQIMPGIILKSSYIYPSPPAACASDSETSILKTQATNASHKRCNSDEEMSDTTSPKEDNMDSHWDELGPVSAKNPSPNDMESNLTQKITNLDAPKHPDYEPIVSDYDSSEAEEDDSSHLTKREEQGKPKYDEQDSSLWQALDSWHSSKEEDSRVNKSEKVDSLGISLLEILDSTSKSTPSIVSKNASGNYIEKQRSQKYSFVADTTLPDKDKFIGGLLDSFKKSDESKMQN